jgi:hypothetical protein
MGDDQRQYLSIFNATGSPCHELTSWDNSTPSSILLGRKESQCEGETKRKKEYTPFLSESKCALSMRGLAQLADEK